ncbi:hypothetical protein R3P38DRAFT_3479451 [Favolaschia claudopus]|uniref:Xylanolytic transcriptional activator regulatory domain-containing protein n=1 Tax=Favolaschia claudopus TaxID=2862362 RepID=A0AAV9ZA48_9AGAR
MFDLVDLHFTHQNVYIPRLHRPIFEREVNLRGCRCRDDAFAATLLLVCAIDSRWSDDPGIAGEGLTCGWRWFNQTLKIPSTVGDHLFGQARLYELQYFSLAVIFLEGSSASQACWMLVGFGFRLAQDIGVHRQKGPKQPPSVEGVLFKRALWVLIYIDGQISSTLAKTSSTSNDPSKSMSNFGKTSSIHSSNIGGVPSIVTFFNCLLRLDHILSILTTQYPPPQTRHHLFVNSAWEERLLVDLDSSLNNWLKRLRYHLRCEPSPENQLFFDQSVVLLPVYFHLRILIHRPSIPIIMQYYSLWRNGGVFTSAMIPLLNVWSIRQKRMPKCMQVLKLCEKRDILSELASVGHLPLPTAPNMSSSSSNVPTENNNTNNPIDFPSIWIPLSRLETSFGWIGEFMLDWRKLHLLYSSLDQMFTERRL